MYRQRMCGSKTVENKISTILQDNIAGTCTKIEKKKRKHYVWNQQENGIETGNPIWQGGRNLQFRYYKVHE